MQWIEIKGCKSVLAVAHDGEAVWVRWGSGRVTGFVGVPQVETHNIANYPGSPAQYIAKHWRPAYQECKPQPGPD